MSVDYALEGSLKLRDDFSRTLSKAKIGFKNFNSGFIKNADKIDKSFNKIAIGAVGMGTGLATIAWKAYGSYRELNNQLVRNQSLMGASKEDSAKLEAQVKNLGKSTIFTAKQVAQAQEYQIMAGYNTNQILETTPKLLKLSIASGEDLASTSDIITDSLTAFGLGTKDLGEYLDVLAKTSTSTNTNIGMLGNAFQSVAASSRVMGEDYKEVALMLGLMANNGIKAEKAGTALRGIYTRLSKPTDDMKKALKSTNTEIYDQNGKFKGLRKIIMESKGALQSLTPEQRNLWLTTIAGTRGMSAWASIMNTSNDEMGKLEKSTYGAEGALDDFNAKMSKADEITFKKMASAWDDVKISLGKALSPIILEKMEKFTGFLTKLSDSGVINSENMNIMFGDIEKRLKHTIELFAGFKIAILAARAAAGDPAAIAELAIVAPIAGGYIGRELGKRENKKLTERQQKFKDAGYSNEALGIEEPFKAPVSGEYGPKAPVLDLNKNLNDIKSREKVTVFNNKEKETNNNVFNNKEKENSTVVTKSTEKATVINLNMNNATFNNGTDIDDFTTSFIEKLQTRE